jgi:LmbE family N-acetylglucosaminyl deacetylase
LTEGYTIRHDDDQGGRVRVLAVGAHPDDLEILCAGTLARYAADGHEVWMCHATTGDMGSFVHGREEISAIRLGEAARSAAVIGATHRCLGLGDGEVNAADPRQKALAVDLVREARPDLIVTHAPNDYMGDHNETSKLVFECSFYATFRNLETGRTRHDAVTPIFYMDTIAGLGFVPTEYVDITETIETKAAMLESHESQLVWLRDHDGVDIVEEMRTAARYRGQQCGVRYAEGFRQCLTWLRGTTRRLLP